MVVMAADDPPVRAANRARSRSAGRPVIAASCSLHVTVLPPTTDIAAALRTGCLGEARALTELSPTGYSGGWLGWACWRSPVSSCLTTSWSRFWITLARFGVVACSGAVGGSGAGAAATAGAGSTPESGWLLAGDAAAEAGGVGLRMLSRASRAASSASGRGVAGTAGQHLGVLPRAGSARAAVPAGPGCLHVDQVQPDRLPPAGADGSGSLGTALPQSGTC